MEDGPTTGPMNVWPGEYVSDVRAEAIARTRGRPGWRDRTRSSRATMMHAAPSSAGQHIMAVSGSATTREARTSSAATTRSGGGRVLNVLPGQPGQPERLHGLDAQHRGRLDVADERLVDVGQRQARIVKGGQAGVAGQGPGPGGPGNAQR